MNRTIRQWLGRTYIITAAATLVACTSEGSLSPDPGAATTTATAAAQPDLGRCDSIRVGEGHRISARRFALGDQIYSWSGTAWTFVAPSATLFESQYFFGMAGTHYAGPTWESLSGSKVVGRVLKSCSMNPTSVPWLLLAATSSDGPGIFRGTTYIQRIRTVGGLPPATPGTVIGELVNRPYSAEYVFYQRR